MTHIHSRLHCLTNFHWTGTYGIHHQPDKIHCYTRNVLWSEMFVLSAQLDHVLDRSVQSIEQLNEGT